MGKGQGRNYYWKKGETKVSKILKIRFSRKFLSYTSKNQNYKQFVHVVQDISKNELYKRQIPKIT